MSCDIQSIVENALSKQVNDLGKPLVDGQVILDKKFFGLFNDDISRRLKAEHQIDSDENVFNVTEATSLASRPDTYGYAKNYYYTRWTLNAPLVAKLEANRRNPPAPSLEELGIKPGVTELFESNPELANEVYEALGFKSFDTKGVSLDTKERDGWKWIKLNGKNIGEVKLVKNDRQSKEVGLSIKLNEEYQNKGYGQIVHTLVADWAKNEFGDTLYSDFDNSQAEINTLLALTKKGYAEQIGDYGTKEDGRYNTDVRAFRIKTSDEIGTITPQQKQQAQQQYSQYLDSIFPGSGVKDIVYHTNNQGRIEFGTRGEKGLFVTPTWELAKTYKPGPYGKRFQLLINSNNVLELSELELMKGLKRGNEDTQKYSEEDYTEYVVFEPEQIYPLGTKQDIEGFKEFVRSEEAQEEYFDSKQREEQLSDYYMGDTALMEQEVKDLERFRDENSNMPDEDIDDYFTSCK